MLRLLKVFACICGVIVFCLSVSQALKQNDAFAKRSKIAIVDPIERYEKKTTTTKKLFITTNTSESFSADLHFKTLAGADVSIHRGIPKFVIDDFEKEKVVYIRYLPDNPQSTRFAGEKADITGYLILIFICLALAIYCWMDREAA